MVSSSYLKMRSAEVKITEIESTADGCAITVSINNLAGHKLPTAYPSRRAWIHLKISDSKGNAIFESGALRPDGSIVGNDNDNDAETFEPHYKEIRSPEDVQIYEAIMATPEGKVTTGLLSAIRFIKDNRILPQGFDKRTAQDDIAVQGLAAEDGSFQGGLDTVRYLVDLPSGVAPFTVEAELWYQPISYRWAQNLGEYDAEEPKRFIELYRSFSDQSAVAMAEDKKEVSSFSQPSD